MKDLKLLSFSWRGPLLEKIVQYYPPEEEFHGLSHAQEVERLTLEISKEPEYKNFNLDFPVLSAAALLHDTGYSRKKENWSIDQRGHIQESMKIAQEILKEIPYFADSSRRLFQVLFLVENHDNTNYQFPFKERGGRPAINVNWVCESETRDENLAAMLAILKEADSRLGTGSAGAQRTIKFNLNQGVPLFAQGDPLRAWMWGESAISCVRLAAKRALLDTITERGWKIAWQGYLEAEELIKRECLRNGVSYWPEIGLKELRKKKGKISPEILEIKRVQPWEELVGILRKIELRGDSTLFPYANARIESVMVGLDEVAPLSYYILKSQLDVHRDLRKLFLTRYAFDLLDLSGVIEFFVLEGKERREYLISPPLIEVSDIDNGRLLLVDGIHRFWLTRELGIKKLRVILISGIPRHLPVMALPLEWKEVRQYKIVPPHAKKRAVRYSSLEFFPDISWFFPGSVTEENYRYFFFRDLSPLGSRGIREPGGKK